MKIVVDFGGFWIFDVIFFGSKIDNVVSETFFWGDTMFFGALPSVLNMFLFKRYWILLSKQPFESQLLNKWRETTWTS